MIADWQPPVSRTARGFAEVTAASTPSATTARASASTMKARASGVVCSRCGSRARPRDQCAMARVHGGRRLCDAVALAFRRLGDGGGRRLGRARLLAQDRWRLVHDDPRRPAAGRSGRAGLPRQLLRGRCFCALGRQASAERSRMGGRGARRRCSTMPSASCGNGRAAPIRPIPAIAPPEGALGEYNGKFMVNQMVLRGCSHATPDGHSRVELPEFLLSAGALAIQRAAPRRITAADACPSKRTRVMHGACKRASPTHPTADDRRSPRDVLAGLTAQPKRLPPKYFYDETGAQLFEQITALPEYYLTRSELAILRDNARRRSRASFPPGAALVEFGSGSSTQGAASCSTRRRSSPPMCRSTSRPKCCSRRRRSFERDHPQPRGAAGRSRLHPAVRAAGGGRGPAARRFLSRLDHRQFRAARGGAFLRHAGRMLGSGATLIIGVDLVKDASILNAAYNDCGRRDRQVQSQPARAHQSRARRQFRSRRFSHHAFYNRERHRIEMHLASNKRQKVQGGRPSIDSAPARPSTPRTATSSRSSRSTHWRAAPAGRRSRSTPTPTSISACTCSSRSKAGRSAFYPPVGATSGAQKASAIGLSTRCRPGMLRRASNPARMASAPLPKFVKHGGTRWRELRKHGARASRRF